MNFGRNRDNEVNIMDLHGLQVEMAIKLVSENLVASKAKGCKTADVIHGKGTLWKSSIIEQKNLE